MATRAGDCVPDGSQYVQRMTASRQFNDGNDWWLWAGDGPTSTCWLPVQHRYKGQQLPERVVNQTEARTIARRVPAQAPGQLSGRVQRGCRPRVANKACPWSLIQMSATAIKVSPL